MKSNEASSIGCDASVFRDQFRDLEKKIRFALSGEPLYLATDSTLKFSGAEDATIKEAIRSAAEKELEELNKRFQAWKRSLAFPLPSSAPEKLCTSGGDYFEDEEEATEQYLDDPIEAIPEKLYPGKWIRIGDVLDVTGLAENILSSLAYGDYRADQLGVDFDETVSEKQKAEITEALAELLKSFANSLDLFYEPDLEGKFFNLREFVMSRRAVKSENVKIDPLAEE